MSMNFRHLSRRPANSPAFVSAFLLVTVVAIGGSALAQDAGELGPGETRWNYQSEQVEPDDYQAPAYVPTLPLMVERLRKRNQALEERVERLEKTVIQVVNVLNVVTGNADPEDMQ